MQLTDISVSLLFLTLLPGSASAQNAAEQIPTYSECIDFVAHHIFMSDLQKECGIALRKDTSDLSMQCLDRIGDKHTKMAIDRGMMISAEFRRQNEGHICETLRLEFARAIDPPSTTYQHPIPIPIPRPD